MTGWNFPSNGGGLIRGVAEAGIQTFTGKEISSLAREICQNSLDAVANENSAVTIEFQRHDIYTKKIPGFCEYKKVLSQCRDFWSSNKKAENFLDNAIAKINLPKTFVLRISDFNTTGLAEPFNPRAMSGWNTLTKIDGGATKVGDAAGSFGIGKNAPFANSFWRMVFYRTLNLQGERAAQGMTRLLSFELDDKNIAAGVGYFGDMKKNLPVPKIDELENISRRTKNGTDIFIYGFDDEKTWEKELISKVIENFLVSIYRGKLRVKIQGREISNANLGDFAEDNAANYYKILMGGNAIKFFETDFHGMGKLKLSVMIDPKIKLNRKVLIVRKSGMKLFELDRISRTLSFTAILELEGRKLNEFFRDMETPSHDNWEPDRYEKNRTLANNYLKELKRWVRDTILSLGEENISEEINVEGLSQMLDFDDCAIAGNFKEVETLDNSAPPEIELVPVPSSEKTFSTYGGIDSSKTQRTKGDITDSKGNPSAIRKLGGKRKRKTLAEHTGEKNPDGENIILEPVGKKINCNKIRVVKFGKRNYVLILEVPQNIPKGRIEIFAVGEDNSHEKLSVTAANSNDANSHSRAENNEISFRNMRKGATVKINFELQDVGNYALGVAVHED